jgi:AraC family transcriptional regulator
MPVKLYAKRNNGETAEGVAAPAERPSRRAVADTLAPWQLRRIEDHARTAALAEPASIAVFAKLCDLSASHLARCFRQTTGRTLRAFVEAIRMERACALLAESELPVKDIATASGFSTPRYFSTAFRRATGETPRAYRARAKAKVFRLASRGTDASKSWRA